MMAWDLIRQKVDFDVIDLDHLKPGQLGQYKLVLIPSTPFGPIPNSGDSLAKAGDVYQLYLSPGNRDYRLKFFEQKGVKLRQAWADDPEVDVVERQRGPETATALSVINRGPKEFRNTVYFNRGDSLLHAALGPKVIGFVSVKHEGLTGALIEHAQGRGEFRYNSDLIAFTGSFGVIAIEPGYAIISALDKGRVTIKSKHLSEPAKLVRLTFGGERREAGFEFKDGALSFEYDPGDKAGRTDMYVALGREMTLERAIGDYLQRTMLMKK
jgi:hypothetical protein